MEGFLMQLGTMSLQASIVICVVLLVRVLYDKLCIPKKYMEWLWCIPYVLMICPWKLQSTFSFWRFSVNTKIQKVQETVQQVQSNLSQNVPAAKGEMITGVVNTAPVAEETIGSAVENAMGNTTTALTEQVTQGMSGSVTSMLNLTDIFLHVAGILWLLGIIVLILYSVISYVKLRSKLLCSISKGENIYYADDIDTPFVLGIFRQKIYLPSAMKQENLCYVLEHERTHIRKGDPIKKLIVYGITVLHWFNPLAWAAFYFCGKDMEMACDEETVKKLGIERKQDYATALLQLASGKRMLLGAPLAFGEGNVKSRIQNIVKYKKVWGIVSFLAMVVIVVMAVGFLTENDSITTLAKLEEDHFVGMAGEPERIKVTIEGETKDFPEAYYETFSEYLNAVEVEKTPISLSRDEDRAKDICIQVGDGGCIYLSSDCKEIWCDNGVKPARSFRVVNPGELQIFLEIQCASITMVQRKEEEAQAVEQAIQQAGEEIAQAIQQAKEEMEQQKQEEQKAQQELQQIQQEAEPTTNEQSFEEFTMENLTFVLPKDIYLGEYSLTMDDCFAGSLLYGNFKGPFIPHSEGVPEAWYAAGGIGIADLSYGNDFEERVIMEDDTPVGFHWYANHSSATKIGLLDGCEMPALIYECEFDILTHPDLVAYAEENDMAIEDVCSTTKYWYVYLVDAEEKMVYSIFLNQTYFNKEDVSELARSVKVVK